ncbi:MAG: M42 family metallopeptidase [Oscillospiraceae bacterium]|jgi:endoglucanase|nr:M42 family metallopeptidase [Oscillospiraceae bacterium]
MLSLVKTLCALNGVSGWEDEVRDAIRRRVAAHADEIREDALGNLMVFRRGAHPDGRTLMLCAHMDEVGFLVKRITDEGYLRFGCIGGFDRRVLPGRRVSVGPDKYPGVIGLKAYHLRDREGEEKPPKVEDLYIDIGARDRAEAEAMAVPGDVCAFYSPPADFGAGLVRAKALDDRAGCACLIQLLTETRPALDTWTVFTVQEEVGARGAHAAGQALSPNFAVVVESTTAAEQPDLPPHKQVCHLGGGAVIPVMDRGAVYDAALTRRLIAAAEATGVPWQYKEFLAGGTDAGALHLSQCGVPTAALALPVRYLHSAHSLADIADLTHLYTLLRAFVAQLPAQA